MRKTFLTFCVAALSLLAVSSCGKIEDSLHQLEEGLANLTERVAALEKKLKTIGPAIEEYNNSKANKANTEE